MVKIIQKSGEADGAAAVGHELDTLNTYTTPGGKLLSIKNAGVEKLAVDLDGNLIGTASNSTYVVAPAEGRDGIQNAVVAANTAGGGIVQLLKGTYEFDESVNLQHVNNVTIQGVGPSTICKRITDSTGNMFDLRGTSIDSQYGPAFNDITEGDTSIFTTNPADATAIVAGAIVRILGIHDLTGEYDVEVHEVKTDGNSSSGEIELTRPMRRSFTSAQSNCVWRRGENITIRDMTITCAEGLSTTGYPLIIREVQNFRAENLHMLGSEDLGVFHSGIYLQKCKGGIIRNCRIEKMRERVSAIYFCSDIIIENCIFQDINPSHPQGGWMNFAGSMVDFQVINNRFLGNNTGEAIVIGSDGAGAPNGACRRVIISGNYVSNFLTGGINMDYVREFVVSNNHFHNIAMNPGQAYQAIIEGGMSKNGVIDSNTIWGGRRGIQMSDMEEVTVSNNTTFNTFEFGIALNRSDKCTVSNNVCRKNTIGGPMLGCYDSTNCTMSGNVGTEGTYGLNIHESFNCTFIANNLYDNTSDGVRVDDLCNDNIFIGNNGGGDGINEGTGSNIFIGNKE